MIKYRIIGIIMVILIYVTLYGTQEFFILGMQQNNPLKSVIILFQIPFMLIGGTITNLMYYKPIKILLSGHDVRKVI